MTDETLKDLALQAELNAMLAGEPQAPPPVIPLDVALAASAAAAAGQGEIQFPPTPSESATPVSEVEQEDAQNVRDVREEAPPWTATGAVKLTLLSLEKRVRSCESAIDMLIEDNANLRRELRRSLNAAYRQGAKDQGGPTIVDHSGGRNR
jgi:hypothetical protein